MRNIKLIWDFRGPAAQKTAAHHEIHLKEFIEVEDISVLACGSEDISEFYSIAYVAVKEDLMMSLRDSLKPHRAEVYSPK